MCLIKPLISFNANYDLLCFRTLVSERSAMLWYLCQPTLTNLMVFYCLFFCSPSFTWVGKSRHLTSGKIKALEVCRSDCHGAVTKFLFLMILPCSPNINCQRSNPVQVVQFSIILTCPYGTFPKHQKSSLFFKHWKAQNLSFLYQKWFRVILKSFPSNKCHHWGILADVSNVTDTGYKNSSTKNV